MPVKFSFDSNKNDQFQEYNKRAKIILEEYEYAKSVIETEFRNNLSQLNSYFVKENISEWQYEERRAELAKNREYKLNEALEDFKSRVESLKDELGISMPIKHDIPTEDLNYIYNDLVKRANYHRKRANFSIVLMTLTFLIGIGIFISSGSITVKEFNNYKNKVEADSIIQKTIFIKSHNELLPDSLKKVNIP